MTIKKDHILIITDDGNGLSIKLSEILKEKGQRTVILSMPKMIKQNKKIQNSDEFEEVIIESSKEGDIQNALREIEEKGYPIGGFIYLGPEKNINSFDEVFDRNEYEINKTVFLIAKYLQDPLKTAAKMGRSLFVTVSRMDGELGIAGSNPYSVIQGGLTGLVKSLNKEWKDVFCRHIDIVPKVDNNTVCSMIIEEISDLKDDYYEVGQNEHGERYTLTTKEVMVDSNLIKEAVRVPDENTVFLVTGGGRGVTADCIIRAAKTYKSKFILIGRTDINEEDPDWAQGIEGELNLKQSAIKYISKTGLKLKPKEIDKMIKVINSKREIVNTLNKVNSYGAKAVYKNINIKNKESLKICIQDTEKQFGKINAFIHGAGNISDKWINKKTDDDFDLVVGTKIFGLINILNIIDYNQLEYIILFSSISAYLGNIGQTDYSMANEILNKFALCAKLFDPDKLIVSIGWGPWEKGMVSDVLKSFYEKMNIKTIPVEEGARLFTYELANTNKNYSQVIIEA